MEKKIQHLKATLQCTRVAVTIAPSDELQGSDMQTSQARLSDVKMKVLRRLSKFGFSKHFSKLQLFLDVTTHGTIVHNSQNRIHWHGYGDLKNVREFYLMYKGVSGIRIEIDTTDQNFKEYLKYCTKWVDLIPEDAQYNISLSDLVEQDHIVVGRVRGNIERYVIYEDLDQDENDTIKRKKKTKRSSKSTNA